MSTSNGIGAGRDHDPRSNDAPGEPGIADAVAPAPRAASLTGTVLKDGFNVAAHGLRGLAAVLVLIAHILGGTAEHIYPDRPDYAQAIIHPWYLGTFGVEIFFVISGFVILPSAIRYDWSEFAARRAVRIYPLFFILSLVFVILNAATNAYPRINNPESVAAGLLFVNLFTGTEQLTPNAWSLSFEVWFYILTAWVVHTAIKRRQLPVVAALAGAAFVIAFPISTYFLIGLGLRLAGCGGQLATRASRLIETISLAVLIWFASRAHFDYVSWTQFANPIVPSILLSITCYFACALRRGSLTERMLGGRLWRYVGDVSYSLYLVHPFAYYGLRLVFAKMGWFGDDVAPSIAMFAAAVVAGSFLATHAMHAMFERWPYRAIFGQKVYTPRPHRADRASVTT